MYLPYMVGCSKQSSEYSCDVCQAGYEINEVMGVDGQARRQCIIRTANCESYTSASASYVTNGLCQRCLPGFKMWAGQCIRLNCETPLDYCTSCPVNFVYYLGKCVEVSVENCALYKNGRCLLCTSQYYLTP